MYRVLLFIAFLAYCSSAPSYGGSNLQKSIFIEQNDETDLIDNTGAGYAYFKKQQVDTRPLARPPPPIPMQDLATYMQASAFKQVPQIISPKTFPTSSGYDTQRFNLPVQSNLLTRNSLNQFQDRDMLDQYQQGDLRMLGPQQVLLPRTNLNIQPNTFSGYSSQPQNRFLLDQPQSTWSNQQRSAGFSSSYGGQGQEPVSSGFLMQVNQENDMEPMTDAIFMSSQMPTQRFISQSQPIQRTSGNDVFRGW